MGGGGGDVAMEASLSVTALPAIRHNAEEE